MRAVPARLLMQMPLGQCAHLQELQATHFILHIWHATLCLQMSIYISLTAKYARQSVMGLQGFLSDGLSYEPHRHVGWYNLGLLHKAQHRPEEAERCLRTAVGLSLTAPVMSFSKLPRLL